MWKSKGLFLMRKQLSGRVRTPFSILAYYSYVRHYLNTKYIYQYIYIYLLLYLSFLYQFIYFSFYIVYFFIFIYLYLFSLELQDMTAQVKNQELI